MKIKIAKYTKIILSITLMTTLLSQGFINGSAVHAEEQNTENLTMNKTATYNKDDASYTISLDAYTTGDVSVVTKSKPTDIVLVLDQSGSMNDDINPTYFLVGMDNQYVNNFPNDSYFKKESDGTSSTLTYVRSYYKNAGFVIYSYNIYRTETGEEVVPLTMKGTNPSTGSGEEYPAIQFYVERLNPVVNPKITALKTAVKQFVNSIEKENGNHRIAVTGFANAIDTTELKKDYYNTEVKIGSDDYQYNSAEIEEAYGKAFQSVDNSTEYSRINASINSLTAEGATSAHLGMEMAGNIFQKDKAADDKERNKVVVMFTDGVPTTQSDFDPEVANKTIEEAKKLKESGVTVFTVGIVDSLDNTADPANPLTNDLNRYMQYVSSNYPKATSLTNGDVGNYNGGKFLFATNQESLNSIFEKIQEEISSTNSTLDETTVLKDYISDYFVLSNEEKDIKVYTQDYTGKDSEGNRTWGNKTPFNASVVFDDTTQSVSVKGFNYKENYVADKQIPIGKRLVVEIKVKVKDGFIGGNAVETNKIESGIYVKDEILKKFDQPRVDVGINFDASAKDASMYITQTLSKVENLIDADLTKEEMQFYYKKDNKNVSADIDGINNKFVDITYEIKIGDLTIGHATIAAGEKIVVWDKNIDTASYTKDTEIKVIMTASPITKTPIGEGVPAITTAHNANATIHVFKPTVKLENDVMFLGEGYNLSDAASVIEWNAEQKNAPKPVGNAPTMTYEFDVNGNKVTNSSSYKAKEDTVFNTDVLANDVNITRLTTFKNDDNSNDGTFKLQVVKGELQLTKKIDNAYSNNTSLNANQTFIFKIEVRDLNDTNKVIATYYQSIDFDNNDAKNNITEKSITLKGLEKGQYIVSEEKSWSWKYGFKSSKTNYKGKSDTLHIGEKTNDTTKPYFGSETGTKINNVDVSNPGTILITNGLKTTNIMGDTANAINIFKGK